jgi:cell division protein FtsI (penicillin-binding protein 3)
MSKGFTSSYRIVLLAGGLFLCFGGLGVRLVWLHVVERDALLATITKTRHQLIVDKARRGDIRDARGAVLATSLSRIVLGVDRQSVRPEDEKKVPQLAALLGLPEMEVRRIFTAKFRSAAPATPAPTASPAATTAGLVFNLNLPPSAANGATANSTPRDARLLPADPSNPPATEAAADFDPMANEPGRWAKLHDEISEQLSDEIEKLGIKALTFDRVYRRIYPSNRLGAHVIGYVNKQQEPAAGIEAYADFYLRAQNGWREGERDGRNRELAQFRTREVPKADGFDVWLSIRQAVQDIVEQELAYIAGKYQPLKATIIVSEPRTGFILGMGNYPSFDLNEYNKVPKEEMARMKNVAVTDIYEPGSVFKIVAAAAALEEGLVTPFTTFDVTPEVFVHKGRPLKMPEEDHRFNTPTAVPLTEVMSYSSNRGAAQLGMLLGEERFDRYARAFGFGRKLGFPVGGEVNGILHPYKNWSAIDITRIPIGHSISATALQMHQAMTVIANEGVLLRPQIIRQIRDAAGEPVFDYDKVELGRVVSKKTADTVAALLMGVATKNGTAPEAAIPGYEVAGKTGTTQKFIDGEWSRKHHVVSFVGFFPASRPQVAISVIIDDADAHAPNGVAYGGRVAAPSFRAIGEKLIPILDIKAPGLAQRPVFAATEGGRR